VNCIDGVIISVFGSSMVDRGFKPGRVKLKNMKVIFVASPLSTLY